MDHLPLPDNPAAPHIEVPFLSSQEYDGGEFTRYASRMGWDQDSFLIEGYWEQQNSESINSLFQTWLYFGLLHAFLDLEIDISDLVTTGRDGSRAVVTSGTLPDYLSRWRTKFASLDPETFKTSARRSQIVLFHASNMCAMFAHDKIGLLPQKLDPSIALSIQLLGLTLCDAFDDFNMANATGITGFREDLFEHSDLIFQRAVKAGWCPNHIARFPRLTEQYYASSISCSWGGRQHEQCTVRYCSQDNIDESCYKIAHVPMCDRLARQVWSDSDACRMADFSVDEICRILAAGQIPLIALSATPGGPVSWRIVSFAADSGLEYSAISHIWADGRGNPTANSLPICQLEYLHNIISAQVDGITFFDDPSKVVRKKEILLWIDTVCVPLQKEFRKLAIQKMAQTYETAADTYVIDAELLEMCSVLAPLQEICVRIRGSRWVSRVWTFQEAMLSRNLKFMLMDGYTSLGYLLMKSAKNGVMSARYAMPLLNSSSRTKRSAGAGGSRALQSSAAWFVQAWNEIATRSTSRFGDECICFATIVQKDPIPLMDKPAGQDRLCALLDLCETVPGALLFAPGPHVDLDGHRWAPLSLLPETTGASPKALILKQEVTASNTGAGILIERPGILFAASRFPNSDLHAFSLDGKWYLVKNVDGDWDAWSWDEVGAADSTLCALIFRFPTWKPHVKGDEAEGLGALVSVSDYDGELVTCTNKCRAIVYPAKYILGMVKPVLFLDDSDVSVDGTTIANDPMVPLSIGECYNEEGESMGWIRGAKELGPGQKWFVR